MPKLFKPFLIRRQRQKRFTSQRLIFYGIVVLVHIWLFQLSRLHSIRFLEGGLLQKSANNNAVDLLLVGEASAPTTIGDKSAGKTNSDVNPEAYSNSDSDKNITTKDVTGLAQFNDGTLGLVADISPERLQPRNDPEALLRKQQQEGCLLGKTDSSSTTSKISDGGHEVLRKVRDGRQELATNTAISDIINKQYPRILCMVYTHGASHDRVRAIAETWGRKCDGFFAASTLNDPDIGAVHVVHKGPEEFGNMWQKIRSMWAYAYTNYYDDFDYFHIAGDDAFVIVENLRAYLGTSPQIQKLLQDHTYRDAMSQKQKTQWRGCPESTINSGNSDCKRPLLLSLPQHGIRGKAAETYPSGGPGYTLNREALRLFAEQGLYTTLVDQIDSREDVLLGSIFSNMGVWTADTRDEDGAWLYHAHDVDDLYKFDGASAVYQPKKLKRKHGVESKVGMASVSKYSVAIHLKPNGRKPNGRRDVDDIPSRIYQAYASIYGICES